MGEVGLKRGELSSGLTSVGNGASRIPNDSSDDKRCSDDEVR